jgi:hypothetical protein
MREVYGLQDGVLCRDVTCNNNGGPVTARKEIG